MKLLTDQAGLARQRLVRAIATLNDRGTFTACQESPASWDDDTSESALQGCAACPVLQLCRSYALSGAVSHGIVGGLSMPELIERERVARRVARRSVRTVAA